MKDNMCKKEHIYIYGAGNRGKELLNIIKDCYAESICVDGFIDKSKEGYIDSCVISSLNVNIHKDKKVVVSVADFETALSIALELRNMGFGAIYWFNVKNNRFKHVDFWAEQCVSCNGWGKATLPHVEIHAMDACNLNCVGCTHYAPIFAKIKPDTKDRIDDIELLKTKISSIVNFCILGGEPLLNNELEKYILTVRNEYPDALAIVVTNGLLIPKCSDEFLHFLSTQNVCVSISEYAPTHQIISSIIDVLNKHNIIYNLRPYNKKQKFNKPLSKEKTGERYCISPDCINVWNRKIARCPTLMYVTELNNKFGLNFPEEGIIDLTSDLNELEWKAKLYAPVPLCDYCSENEIEWAVCGKEVRISDFVSM